MAQHPAPRDLEGGQAFAVALGQGNWKKAVELYNDRLRNDSAPLPALRWLGKTRPARTRTVSFVSDGHVFESAQAWRMLWLVGHPRHLGAILSGPAMPAGHLSIPLGHIAFNLLMAPAFAVRIRRCAECQRFFFDQTRNISARFCRSACRIHFHNRHRYPSSN